jgi:hypothetical protein
MNAGDVIREEPEAQRNMLPINDVPQAAQRPATTKRRPLLARVRQFSLRQLLLLVLVAAAGLGLRTALASRSIAQHAAAAKLRRAGVMIELREPWKQQTLWQRTIFGDNRYDFVDRVVIDDITLSTDEMNGLDALSGITRCWISNCPTTNRQHVFSGTIASPSGTNRRGRYCAPSQPDAPDESGIHRHAFLDGGRSKFSHQIP